MNGREPKRVAALKRCAALETAPKKRGHRRWPKFALRPTTEEWAPPAADLVNVAAGEEFCAVSYRWIHGFASCTRE
jgi:hypothetical protein